MATAVPKKIKIGHYIFDVCNMTKDLRKHGEVFGVCDQTKQKIHIDVTATPAVLRDTLLHEIMHGVYWMFNLEDENKEEKIVSSLATGLLAVFRDNPEVAKFLMEK